MSNAERVRDIDYLIRGLVLQRRAAVTDRFRPELVHKDIAELEAEIARLQARIEQQRLRLADPIGRIEAIDARIAELNTEKALAANSSDVAKLERAMEAVEQLRAMGLTDEDLDALRAELQASKDKEAAA